MVYDCHAILIAMQKAYQMGVCLRSVPILVEILAHFSESLIMAYDCHAILIAMQKAY